ncbi:hydroxymethylpyrimidine ABC transporter substrate-binding component [Psychromonas sp. CNPT3]|uniref:ABC transporter substrate-binding protein n=1 Tax=Psychromonas sp. CNPT3 TaxID=314282 RepID=UPI00006E425B|nr:ABC transporter substrate-binding protein [Psychromonas sp. CNPT3]AGH81063.1 hydroxymethylpyrimidine ABC transporter substrate-binding component [Psychromonas sp. CNPT3]
MNNKMKLCVLALVLSVFSLNSYAQKMTLMLDWFVNPNHGPIIIAQQHGYFKAQGLSVDIQEPADPSMPPKLVAANKVDMAVSYQPSLIIDVAAGLPLIRSATLIATPLNTLIVLDDNKINTLADLKGKKIGVSISGSEDASIKAMLEGQGLKFSDVQLINVGWALSSSLASGKVDAIWGGYRNFEMNQLTLEGFANKGFYPEENGVPIFDELVFIANSKTYDKQKIRAFNKALEQATTYILNHPDAAWKEFVSYAPDTLNNELNKRAWKATLSRFALRPSAIDLGRYDNYAAFMYANKIIKVLPKAKDYMPDFQ